MSVDSRLTQITSEVAAALRAAGVPEGVPLLVHSGMGMLAAGLRSRGIRGRDLMSRTCTCFADALDLTVGPEGTICVPGFFYNYARKGLSFDARASEPDESLGGFPHFFFRHRMRCRSLNPLVSLMTAGRQSEDIAAAPWRYGNGVRSAWAQLVQSDGWMLFFGATPASMTFSHHVEHLAGVPHLYNKLYRVPVIDLQGRHYTWSICSVRFLDDRFPVTYALERVGDDLSSAGILTRGRWERVHFSVAPMRAVQDYLLDRLAADPFYLLDHEPTFVRGVIPDDGPSAAATAR